MANYSQLLADINAAIYENNQQEIDALEVRAILREMVTALGAGYLFKDIAETDTDPGSPDSNLFYLALEVGTYTNFDSLEVAEGEIAFLCWDGSWSKKSIPIQSGGGGGGGTDSRIVNIEEDIFAFVDESLNIGAYLDEDGFHAPNIIDYEIVNL